MEHDDLLALVPDAAVTHAAVASGNWSSPATWGGSVPGFNANVLIPDGKVVTVDGIVPAFLRTIRADGELKFSGTVNTGLTVETIVVTPNGKMTAATPGKLSIDFRAKTTTFANDRRSLGCGLLSMAGHHGMAPGFVSLVATVQKTPFVALARNAKAGDSSIFTQVRSGWQIGDKLVLSSGSPTKTTEYETATILAFLPNQEIRLEFPLQFDHAGPDTTRPTHVANLTRNIRLRSLAISAGERAHAMFMHTNAATLDGVAFENMGRTRKSAVIDDPKFDPATGAVLPGTGSNPRGRYSLHFHKGGADWTKPPARVTRCTVSNDPGWGASHHSAYVVWTSNVFHECLGAGVVTEAGDEIGVFDGNISIGSKGSGASTEDPARVAQQDWGHEGNGFWFQSLGGLEVKNNIAANHAWAAFNPYIKGLKGVDDNNVIGSTEKKFLVANMANPALAPAGTTEIAVEKVPARFWDNNLGYASKNGMVVAYNGSLATSEFRRTKLWNCQARTLAVLYSQNVDCIDSDLYAQPGAMPNTVGIAGANEGQRAVRYLNSRIEGFAVGIQKNAFGGDQVFDGVTFKNNKVEIEGKISFLGGQTTIRNAAFLESVCTSGWHSNNFIQYVQRSLNTIFLPHVLTFGDYQLYAPQQEPSFIPFEAGQAATWAGLKIPTELVSKTNAELWAAYGITIGGALPPSDAVPVPACEGRFGSQQTYHVLLSFTERPPSRLNYLLKVYDLTSGALLHTDVAPVTLAAGWNRFTREIGGVTRTMFVWGA